MFSPLTANRKVISGLYLAICLATSPVWIASSKVGDKMITWGLGSLVSTLQRLANTKAAVFPVPELGLCYQIDGSVPQLNNQLKII